MDVRHQVFVSSTFRDLVEERREVIQALLELDCIPAGMELFPASNQAAIDLIQEVILQSDYYIVIVGGRYGSTNAEGVSYTELEYDYAVSIDKPVLGFLHGDPGSLAIDASELDPNLRLRLEQFRKKVETRHCKYWTSAAELGGVVSRSLVQERKRNPTAGWVRSDLVAGPEVLERFETLREENERLKAEINNLVGSALPGTEDLEQGSDTLQLSVEYEGKRGKAPSVFTIESTWDEVVGMLGPLMYDEASEQSLWHRLRLHLEAVGRQEGAIPSTVWSHEIYPSAETRATITVQFVALRIIEKSIRKRSLRDSDTYWTLTTYGERYVTGLLARRRD